MLTLTRMRRELISDHVMPSDLDKEDIKHGLQLKEKMLLETTDEYIKKTIPNWKEIERDYRKRGVSDIMDKIVCGEMSLDDIPVPEGAKFEVWLRYKPFSMDKVDGVYDFNRGGSSFNDESGGYCKWIKEDETHSFYLTDVDDYLMQMMIVVIGDDAGRYFPYEDYTHQSGWYYMSDELDVYDPETFNIIKIPDNPDTIITEPFVKLFFSVKLGFPEYNWWKEDNDFINENYQHYIGTGQFVGNVYTVDPNKKSLALEKGIAFDSSRKRTSKISDVKYTTSISCAKIKDTAKLSYTIFDTDKILIAENGTDYYQKVDDDYVKCVDSDFIIESGSRKFKDNIVYYVLDISADSNIFDIVEHDPKEPFTYSVFTKEISTVLCHPFRVKYNDINVGQFGTAMVMSGRQWMKRKYKIDMINAVMFSINIDNTKGTRVIVDEGSRGASKSSNKKENEFDVELPEVDVVTVTFCRKINGKLEKPYTSTKTLRNSPMESVPPVNWTPPPEKGYTWEWAGLEPNYETPITKDTTYIAVFKKG